MVNRMFREVCLKRTLKPTQGLDYAYFNGKLLPHVNELRTEMEWGTILRKSIIDRDLLSLLYVPQECIIKVMKYEHLSDLAAQPLLLDDPNYRLLILFITYIIKRLGFSWLFNKDDPPPYYINVKDLYYALMRGAYRVGNDKIINWLNILNMVPTYIKVLLFVEACRKGHPDSITAFIKSGLKPDEYCIQAIIKRGDLQLLPILLANQEEGMPAWWRGPMKVLNRRDTYTLIEWAILKVSPQMVKGWLNRANDKIDLLNMASLKGNMRLIKLLFELGVNRYKMVLNRAINKNNHELIEYIQTYHPLSASAK